MNRLLCRRVGHGETLQAGLGGGYDALLTAMFAIACLATPFLADAADKPSTNPVPDIRIDGDTLIYIGGTNDNGLEALKTVLAKVPDGQITKMLVNSGGGDTKAAIQIGFIIADLKPNLTIDTGRFPSCANLIALAAATITIRENAFLGWHGNDRGLAIAAAEEGVTLREHLRAIVAAQASDVIGPDGKPVTWKPFSTKPSLRPRRVWLRRSHFMPASHCQTIPSLFVA